MLVSLFVNGGCWWSRQFKAVLHNSDLLSLRYIWLLKLGGQVILFRWPRFKQSSLKRAVVMNAININDNYIMIFMDMYIPKLSLYVPLILTGIFFIITRDSEVMFLPCVFVRLFVSLSRCLSGLFNYVGLVPYKQVLCAGSLVVEAMFHALMTSLTKSPGHKVGQI